MKLALTLWLAALLLLFLVAAWLLAHDPWIPTTRALEPTHTHVGYEVFGPSASGRSFYWKGMRHE